MVEIFEFSKLEYKVTVINMVSAFTEKVDNIQEKLDNVCREKNSDEITKRNS